MYILYINKKYSFSIKHFWHVMIKSIKRSNSCELNISQVLFATSSSLKKMNIMEKEISLASFQGFQGPLNSLIYYIFICLYI